MARRALTVALALLLAACQAEARDAGKKPAPASTLSYVERVTGGADAKQPLPTLIAMHGLGDRADRFIALFEGFDAPARILAVQAPDPWQRGFSWFPTRMRDNDPEALSEGMQRAAWRVIELIESEQRKGRIQGRPVVTGFSQGGMVSFTLAVRHPERIAAAFPVGGTLPKPLWPAAGAKSAPIVAFHGEADRIVTIAPTRAVIDHLRGAGASAELVAFPKLGHRISPPLRQQLFAKIKAALARR